MSRADLEIRPLTGSIGAEVYGVDLRRPMGEALCAALRQAWLKHLVLFFPGQNLNNAELKDFGAAWGPLQVYDFSPRAADDPEVVELAATKGVGPPDMWHTDLTHWPSPSVAGVLSMVKLPLVGGDTMWSNQYEAYESLSAPMRSFLDGLSALHEYPKALLKHTAADTAGAEDRRGAEHPLVRVHPETGRRFLYANRMYTVRIRQLSRGESQALLAYLFAHSVDPRFTVRYRWSEGTVAIWDNRCTQHMVVNDFEGERIIRRVTVGGDVVVGGPSPWETFQPTRRSVAARLENAEVAERAPAVHAASGEI